MHHSILSPTVFIQATDKIQGAGTIIFSRHFTMSAGRKTGTRKVAHTYVLTNWHVIDPNISFHYARRRRVTEDLYSPSGIIRERWEAKRTPLTVKVFRFGSGINKYVRYKTYKADIVACSKKQDLALLRLRSGAVHPNVALLARKDTQLVWSDDVWAVGCPLSVPLPTKGNPSGLARVDGKWRLVTTCPIALGNSGGGLYRFCKEEAVYELIGVTTEKEEQAQHLSYSIPTEDVYKFLEENSFGFIRNEQHKPALQS